MTEPKIKLTADHPEFIKCKESAKKLYQELEDVGVNLTGCGVSLNKAKDGPAIHIMLLKKAGLKEMPATYEGYEVDAIVTGKIVAA